MSIKNIEVYAEKASYGRYVKVWMTAIGVTPSGDMIGQVVAPMTLVTVSEVEKSDPALELDTRTAQNLLDALWSIGLRPNNGEGMDAQVDAIKAHLEDMRTLVFKK